ncbi:MAG: DNA methyltransferase [Bacteroidia bacterium]|nr:DNA methyltransferase [Bacteroidia bacterium]
MHRLHPYLGKFIPQLAEALLRKFFRPGQRVLDPFVGSGTTLIQANELGIHAIGFDVSAFNVLLCRAKIARYDLSRLREEILSALEVLEPTLWRSSAPPEVLAECSPIHPYLQEWYASSALQELLLYRHTIETGDYQYKDLLRVILSRAARSARLVPHYELDFPKQPQREPYYCYKHRRICHPTQSALPFLRRYSYDTLRRIEEFARLRTEAQMEVYHADSREAEIPPVDGVLTSPPYLGLIDYHAQHAYAYALLELPDLRYREIGLPSAGTGEKAQKAYIEDIAKAFGRILEQMPKGGWLIIVANDRYGLYTQIAKALSVEPYAELHRHVNRRTGLREGEFFETVFVWRKK